MRKIVVFLSVGLLSLFIFNFSIAREYNKKDFPKLTEQEIREATERASQVTVTHWVDDPQGRRATTFAEWRDQKGEVRPLEIKSVETRGNAKDLGRFAIIVNAALYPQISTSITTYVDDLVAEGFIVDVFTSSFGTPPELRSFLNSQYGLGMTGCLFVGDLPVAWYEMFDCFDEGADEEFPCDYYYMDLDGIFTDNDGDGMYDDHSGDMFPEIYVGRLTASTLTMSGADEVTLTQNYFRKNHEYRQGLFRSNYRGLMFVDDDWVYDAEFWNENLGMVYCATTLEYDEYETVDVLYESEICEGYEFVQVCVHSNPWGHYFNAGPHGSGGVTQNTEIRSFDAPGVFYNLFACSNSRYIEDDYMGGWYIFTTDHGLCALGSTKTGSMLYFDIFYDALAQGANMGEAFRDWFAEISSWPWWFDNQCWFYGMTLLGDPTLKPYTFRPPLVINEPNFKHARLGTPYYSYVTASGGGGTPPFNWSIIDGAIPTGLSFNPDDGTLIGFTQTEGDFYFSIEASDVCDPQFADTVEAWISVMEVCGDINNDNKIDLLDILYLIDYKFKDGPEPPVLGACDLDGDDVINLLDILFLIDYKFKDGPAPYCFY